MLRFQYVGGPWAGVYQNRSDFGPVDKPPIRITRATADAKAKGLSGEYRLATVTGTTGNARLAVYQWLHINSKSRLVQKS